MLLVTAGGLAALFATASQAPRRVLVAREFIQVIAVPSGCSFAQGALKLPGPVALDCRTRHQAERLGARVSGSTVRGTTVVYP